MGWLLEKEWQFVKLVEEAKEKTKEIIEVENINLLKGSFRRIS